MGANENFKNMFLMFLKGQYLKKMARMWLRYFDILMKLQYTSQGIECIEVFKPCLKSSYQ